MGAYQGPGRRAASALLLALFTGVRGRIIAHPSGGDDVEGAHAVLPPPGSRQALLDAFAATALLHGLPVQPHPSDPILVHSLDGHAARGEGSPIGTCAGPFPLGPCRI